MLWRNGIGGVESCGGKTQGEGGEKLVTVGNTVY